MAISIPDNLLFPESKLRLYFEDSVRPNRTRTAVVLEGTRGGFLSLANAILFLQNNLEDSIPIHGFQFVETDIRFTVKCRTEQGGRLYGFITNEGPRDYVWELSEDNLSLVAASIHSLGHLNPEVHMDDGFADDEISVYCVVE